MHFLKFKLHWQQLHFPECTSSSKPTAFPNLPLIQSSWGAVGILSLLGEAEDSRGTSSLKEFIPETPVVGETFCLTVTCFKMLWRIYVWLIILLTISGQLQLARVQLVALKKILETHIYDSQIVSLKGPSLRRVWQRCCFLWWVWLKTSCQVKYNTSSWKDVSPPSCLHIRLWQGFPIELAWFSGRRGVVWSS